MFVTGPDVIRTVTGEDVGFEELGGGRTHATRSGVAHHLAESEDDAIAYVRELLSFLPSNNLSEAPLLPAEHVRGLQVDEEDLFLDEIVPNSPNQPYDMTAVLAAVLDDGEFLQVHELFAPNVLTGFGRVEGRPVGIVANQPSQLAGTLDIDASEKAARFVRLCDAFNVPVLTFVDVPGFLPGTDQEWNGIIRRGAKLLYAYAEATVPLVTVITRKAYGGAYIVMGSKEMGADVCLAWPSAQIAVMGAQGAVNILHRSTLKETAEAGGDVEAKRRELVDDYELQLANPYVAAERGYVDGVIAPSETRVQVVRPCGRWPRSARRCRPRSTGTSRCDRQRPAGRPGTADRAAHRARPPRAGGTRGADRRPDVAVVAAVRTGGVSPGPGAALALGRPASRARPAAGARPGQLAGQRPPPLRGGGASAGSCRSPDLPSCPWRRTGTPTARSGWARCVRCASCTPRTGSWA